MAQIFSSADLVLAARLEVADATNVMRMAQSAAGNVESVAFEPFAGGFAIFAGIGLPMTHAMGIGMRGAVSQEELERMEAFFRDRGSACIIDLCPMADTSVIAFIQSRPYRVVEFNNVMARKIDPNEIFEPVEGVRPVREGELPQWARVISEAFSESMPVSESMIDLMSATCKGVHCWFAGESDPVGGAAMAVQEGVALFTGDAMLQTARRQGWQTRLIRERLAAAQRLGCQLASTSVLPGSASHRNYERAGFQLIYMRVNVMREFGKTEFREYN
jgi:GNAT superfamily N-acetyltransferase